MKKLFLTIAIGLSLSCMSALAQQASLPPVKLSDFDNYEPARCEDRSAAIDFIHQKTPPDVMIIVVARLGSGETRPDLNRRRLRNVRAFLTEYLLGEGRREPETIGMVEGVTVGGYGRLEFYVSGKLVWLIKVRQNSDVDFGSCYPPDDSYIRNSVYDPCWVKSHRMFYPCRDRYVRRNNKRR